MSGIIAGDGVYGGGYQTPYIRPLQPQAMQPQYWRPEALRGQGTPGSAASGLMVGGTGHSANTGGSFAAPTGPASWSTTPATGVWGTQRVANDNNYSSLQGYYANLANTQRLNMMPRGQRQAAMAAAGGGGSGGTLADGYQRAFDEAKAANEQRYLEGLSGYQNRYERNMNYLEGAGQQEAKDINQSYDNQGDKINQDLVSRGLRGSTIAENMAMGNNRERMNDQGRLQERLRQQRIATDAGLSGDQLRYMEARNDTYPNYNQLASLSEGLGQAGYGVGGYSGGGYDIAPPQQAGYSVPQAMQYGGGGYGGGYRDNSAARANMTQRRAEIAARRPQKLSLEQLVGMGNVIDEAGGG